MSECIFLQVLIDELTNSFSWSYLMLMGWEVGVDAVTLFVLSSLGAGLCSDSWRRSI